MSRKWPLHLNNHPKIEIKRRTQGEGLGEVVFSGPHVTPNIPTQKSNRRNNRKNNKNEEVLSEVGPLRPHVDRNRPKYNITDNKAMRVPTCL